VTPPSVLPFTGSNVGSIALFGALGILAGLALMVATRKPRRQ
jgi:LPXTG-motif cell wall-anchored protein